MPSATGITYLYAVVAGLLMTGIFAAPAYAQQAFSQGANYINPAQFDQTALCTMIFSMTNTQRAQAGLPPFSHQRALAGAAAQHSADMAKRDYFAHKSKGLLRRADPRDRMATYGYQPRMSAENIAMIPTINNQVIQTSSDGSRRVSGADYNTYERLAQYAMQQWMDSPGHRKNILSPQLTSMGVGVAIGFRGNVPYVYLTQDFGG